MNGPGWTRPLVAGLAAFNTLGAGLGAIGLATGWLDLGPEVTGRLPWGSAVFGAAALALIVALPNAVLTLVALRRDARSGPLSILAGVLLVGWIVVELAFIQELSFLHPSYIAVGLLQVGVGARAARVVGRTAWIWWYIVLAFTFSWAWWVPMAVTGQVARAGQGWPTHLLGLTGPALAAIVATAFADGRAGLVDLWRRATLWRVELRWWLLVLLTLALSGLGFLAGWWQGDPVALRDLGRYSGAPAVDGGALVWVVVYVLLVNGFGEELGWRGFLAHHLLPVYGRVRTASLIWLVWALWHAPLFLVVESFRHFTAFTAVGWLVGLWFGSYFLTWLYESTGGSVLLVAAWHTAYNISTSTEATAGVAAAVSSVLVMAWVVGLLVRTRWTRTTV